MTIIDWRFTDHWHNKERAIPAVRARVHGLGWCDFDPDLQAVKVGRFWYALSDLKRYV